MIEIGLELQNAGRTVLWRLIDRELFVLGSNPECDLCVPDEQVAPIQALLRSEEGRLTLENRHMDGTRVGESTIHESLQLADGDAIQLGEVTARVRFRSVPAGKGKTRTLMEEPAPARSATVSVPERLPGQRWPLDGGGLSVGSDPDNDIVLDDPYVSGFHARLWVEGGRCLVRDLDSRNGVFVAEQKVREGQVPLGCQLRVGQTILMVSEGEEDGNLPQSAPSTQLIGSSKGMEKLRKLIRRVAHNDAPVLVTGETGTGKEVVARLLCDLSPRANRPFVAINCGALGRSLIEAELFGHEKGAFTGATNRRAGAFETAHRGTLFLDEIGEIPVDLQPQLLRVLESGEVRRVGSATSFSVDVRLIAATNRSLSAEVAAGNFREDLFHRLHVLSVETPPLRQRAEDIPELTQFFLDRFAPPGQRIQISKEALAKLTAHPWPGNVRELRNVLQRAVLMRDGDVLSEEEISFSSSTLANKVEAASAISNRTLAELEREAIIVALTRYGGNRTEAAVALGVSRSTIHRKVEEFGIDVAALVPKK